MRRKILQVNSSLGLGSTGKIVESICGLAAASDWECWIAHSSRYEGQSQFNHINVSTKFGEYLHYIHSLLLDRHGLGSTVATRAFVQKLDREIRPDIIHLHNIHGYYINYEILFEYLNKAGIPVVWTFHDCWPMTGHCAHYENVRCNRWITGCHDCPNKSEYPMSVGLDYSDMNYRYKHNLFGSVGNLTIVAVSEWMRRQVLCSYFKNHEVTVINNGVDTGVFRARGSEQLGQISDSLGVSGKKVLLGVASSWSRQKGLQDFISLSERLDPDYVIILVGLKREQISQLPDNIVGVERTESVIQLADLYSIADVFVNPTYGDTFPTTNIEALACGTPVVTYCTGGSPEAVTPDTGLVVDAGDVDMLKSAIDCILEQDRGNFRYTCRQRAEACYEKNDRFKEYIELYECLVT